MKYIIIIGVLGAIAVLLLFYLYYMGFFNKIEITEKEMGPYKVAFKEHIGDYKETGKIMDEIYHSLLDDGVETYKGFGIYYDDPKVVKKDKLRSIAGSIIEEKDYDKIDKLKDKYGIKTIDKTRSITTEFPFKNKMSIMFGIMKVYPELNKYIDSKGYKRGYVMEIYDVPNKKTIYVAEIKE
jgi:hypothetical protein